MSEIIAVVRVPLYDQYDPVRILLVIWVITWLTLAGALLHIKNKSYQPFIPNFNVYVNITFNKIT